MEYNCKMLIYFSTCCVTFYLFDHQKTNIQIENFEHTFLFRKFSSVAKDKRQEIYVSIHSLIERGRPMKYLMGDFMISHTETDLLLHDCNTGERTRDESCPRIYFRGQIAVIEEL